MIVKNKATGRQYELDEQGWQKLLDLKVHKLYTVIDKTPVNLRVSQVEIPQKIIEFQVEIPQKIIEFQVQRPQKIVIADPAPEPVREEAPTIAIDKSKITKPLKAKK
jgi:hypothetical protein